MVKYRDVRSRPQLRMRWPRGRGSLLQDSMRVAGKFIREVRDDMRSGVPKLRDHSTDVIFDVLGLPLRRKMLRRLKRGGAMSISKLAEPFKISLPAAQKHVNMMEQCGLITTKKQSRSRICIYNAHGIKNLHERLLL